MPLGVNFVRFMAVLIAVLSVGLGFAKDDAKPTAWGRSLEVALRNARINHQPTVVLFTAKWCGWSEKFSRSALRSSKVKTLLLQCNRVQIDADSGDRSIASRHRIEAYPTTLILDPLGFEVTRITGYANGETFGNFLKNSIQACAELPALRQRQSKNPKDRAALVGLIDLFMRCEALDTAESYLAELIKTATGRIDPVIAKYENLVGDAFQNIAKYSQAIPHFARAKQYSSDTNQRAYAMLSIGACCFSLKQFDRTIKECEAVLKLPNLSRQDRDIATQMITTAQTAHAQ